MNIVGVSIFDNYDDKLNEILEGATYSEIRNYIYSLPTPSDNLSDWNMDYTNQFYKMANRLYERRQIEEDIEEQIRLDNQINVIYFAYCYTKYGHTLLSFKEFITFSRLLCFWFTDYFPTIKRDGDNSFHSQDKRIEEKVNSIAYSVNHSSQPHAFEFDKTRLELLLKKLYEKNSQILENFFYENHVLEYKELVDEAVIVRRENHSIMQYLKERKEEQENND